MYLSNEDLRRMSLKDIEAELQNRVYSACWLLEQLESVRKVNGNGHHMMQAVARAAADVLRDHWSNRDEVG